MRRALRLAVASLGRTWPNPGVGCVLVRAGQVIGAGRHERCGAAHAEIRALEDCAARGLDPRGACAYVTLAPCTRHGRTGPCAEALIDAGITRVVAALADPNQDAASTRFAAAGCVYEEGCEAELAWRVHGGFLRRVQRGWPRLTGKWACTLDGFLACRNGHSAWISGQTARALSRRRRRAFDAILVGAGTAAADDPQLLASARQRTPLRIVVSAHARLAVQSRLVRSAATAPLLLIHDDRAASAQLAALRQHGVQTRSCADAHDAHLLAETLGAHGLNEVLIEGGSAVHASFLAADLYDRLEIYQGPLASAGGLPISAGPGPDSMRAATIWSDEVPPRLLGHTCLRRLCRRPQSDRDSDSCEG